MAREKEKGKKARKPPYLPRFTYEYCVNKLIALSKYNARPCRPSEFAKEGLRLKSVGTIGTTFACLKELGWVQRIGAGYDLTSLGTKVARYAELGLKKEAAEVVRQTVGNVGTLKALTNYMKIDKKRNLKEIANYIGRAYGESYRFSPKYLKDIAQNCISFLEAAAILHYDPKEGVYKYEEKAEGAPQKKKIETIEEAAPAVKGEGEEAEIGLAGIPVRLHIQVTDKTDVEELRKRIRAVKKMLKEESR